MNRPIYNKQEPVKSQKELSSYADFLEGKIMGLEKQAMMGRLCSEALNKAEMRLRKADSIILSLTEF